MLQKKDTLLHTPSKALIRNAQKGHTSWLEPDTKRPGADYKDFPADKPEVCQEVCADDPDCKAFTYSWPDIIEGTRGRCYLKSAVPEPVGDDCCVSGVKPSSSGKGPVREVTPEGTSGGKGGGMVLVRPVRPVDRGMKQVTKQPPVTHSGGHGLSEKKKRPVHGRRIPQRVTPTFTPSETKWGQTEVKEQTHRSKAALDTADAIDLGDEGPAMGGQPQGGARQGAPSPYGDIVRSIKLTGRRSHALKDKRVRSVQTSTARAKIEDGTGLQSLPEMLMLSGVIDRVIRKNPDCKEFRKSMVFMIHGGRYAKMDSGSLKWQYEEHERLSTSDPRVQAIFNAKDDLNFRIRNLTLLHKDVRRKRLSKEFLNTPLTAQKVESVVNAVSGNLNPESIKRFEQLDLIKTSNKPESKVRSHLSTYGMKNTEMAKYALAGKSQIQEVCSMKEKTSSTPQKVRILWENGYAFLLGSGFGWSPGSVFLEYIDRTCGGNAQRCEDLRLKGKPFPAKKVALKLISRYSWTDSMIGVRLPRHLPDGLVGFSASETRASIRIVIPGSNNAVSSPPVEFRRKEPFVTGIKTDSGFDPSGVLLYGHWVTSFETKMRMYIFWIRPHKLVQGAGLLNINCPDCPRGEWVEGGHLVSPGDNIYIYGLDFGNKPGDVFLTYDDPTKPGSKLSRLRRSIPVEPGGKDWWKDDRIHIRVKKETPPPDRQMRPNLVIVDSKGHWITSNYGIVFTPRMAVRVVSGKKWIELGHGEDDYIKVSPDGSSMIVVHPTGGCGILDTNEKGRDWFFKDSRPRSEIQVIREEFVHLPPDGSDGQYFKAFAKGLILGFAEKGLAGLFEAFAKFAGGNIVRSILGDAGTNSLYPQKSNFQDIHDPRSVVDWENTCVGPYANKPVKYYARFILYGPEHLLYPSK